MITAPKMCENPCETCAKKGLPLLLTRYALMPKETGAPVLSGKLKDPDLDKVPLGGHAHYGLRLLRSGYVYVFDEKHSLLDEYFVTHDGFLSKQPKRRLAAAPTVKAEQNSLAPKAVEPIALTPSFAETMQLGASKPAPELRCARNGAAPMAGLITVSASANAIWIAFSNVEWTSAVIVKHMDAAFRAKHMRKITVSGGKVLSQDGCEPIDEIKTHVTEYKMGQETAQKAFAKWCPHQYNGRQFAAEKLLKAIKSDRPEGGAAIVALHDPVGLAMEIARLMVFRKASYLESPARAKALFAASAIETLEAQVKAQAQLSEILKAASLADNAEYSPADYNTHTALTATEPVSNAGAAQKLRTSLTPAGLEAIANRRWREYTHTVRGDGTARFNENEAKKWLEKHYIELQAFDVAQILPLARAHAAWMQHRCMVNHMSCTHDSTDEASGTAFTASLSAAMDHTWDMLPCYDLYLKWIKEGGSASENLVMRAVALNQDRLSAEINKADKPSLDFRAFPSDAVFGGLASRFNALSEQSKNVHGKLMAGLSGVAIKYWDEFQSGKVSPTFAAAMSGASGKQIVRLPMTGTRSQMIEAYVTQISRLNPSMILNQNQLRQAVAAQTRLMALQGVKLDQPRKLAWFVMLDAEAARTVLDKVKAQGLAGQALADELTRAVMRSPQAIRDLELNAISAMARASQKAKAATMVGAVLMAWNYSKLEEDLATGMSHELSEASAKLWAGRLAVGGFASEQLGKALLASGEQRLKNAPGLSLIKVGRVLATWGGRASMVSGVFVGLWDMGKAWGEYDRGDMAMARAYAVAGVSAAWLAIFSITGPLGWVLLGILLLTTLWIETQKDNNLQEWLARCHFGSNTYEDAERQLVEYQHAMQ